MKIYFSRRVIRTKDNFYCKCCNTIVYRGYSRQVANCLTDNHQKIYCGICGTYIGKIDKPKLEEDYA